MLGQNGRNELGLPVSVRSLKAMLSNSHTASLAVTGAGLGLYGPRYDRSSEILVNRDANEPRFLKVLLGVSFCSPASTSSKRFSFRVFICISVPDKLDRLGWNIVGDSCGKTPGWELFIDVGNATMWWPRGRVSCQGRRAERARVKGLVVVGDGLTSLQDRARIVEVLVLPR